MKTQATAKHSDLAAMTLGQTLTLGNARKIAYTVVDVVDMAKLPNLAAYIQAICVIRGPRGATYTVNTRVNGMSYLESTNGRNVPFKYEFSARDEFVAIG